MALDTSDWIVVVGIIIATILGILALYRKNSSKETSINVSQKSGAFSKGNQSSNINIKDSDDR